MQARLLRVTVFKNRLKEIVQWKVHDLVRLTVSRPILFKDNFAQANLHTIQSFQSKAQYLPVHAKPPKVNSTLPATNTTAPRNVEDHTDEASQEKQQLEQSQPLKLEQTTPTKRAATPKTNSVVAATMATSSHSDEGLTDESSQEKTQLEPSPPIKLEKTTPTKRAATD
ncbi:Aste57867_14572 [Aphanomyces stellatus]|uniref:Aste57867_14572 protein n=1 Tax=Aphanomyces stellatus TaxID=120398 RepID=A0A485L1T4_9STRA|nr:hypothetical protein As57867_014518 [Aphanomyces stellatus]VFT91392.1 Aste57867_14572 [Aphanomyces stellatus]